MASSTPYRIRVVGAAPTPLRDAFHGFLRMPWWRALSLLVAGYLAVNALFASLYLEVGGIANARPGSFADAYYFSVQTMGTIGYGAMHPTTPLANAVVIAQSVTSLLIVALATGLVFAKFSRSTARVAFMRRVAIAPIDAVPTLHIRIGNERGNNIVEAAIRVVLTRTERTREGVTFYRSYDLRLVRDHASVLTRSFTVLHTITGDSPLLGKGPDEVAADEVELLITVVGLDDVSGQTVHAIHRYLDHDLAWGARPADVLSETPDGDMLLDLTKFHELVPTQPAAGFPYPR